MGIWEVMVNWEEIKDHSTSCHCKKCLKYGEEIRKNEEEIENRNCNNDDCYGCDICDNNYWHLARVNAKLEDCYGCDICKNYHMGYLSLMDPCPKCPNVGGCLRCGCCFYHCENENSLCSQSVEKQEKEFEKYKNRQNPKKIIHFWVQVKNKHTQKGKEINSFSHQFWIVKNKYTFTPKVFILNKVYTVSKGRDSFANALLELKKIILTKTLRKKWIPLTHKNKIIYEIEITKITFFQKKGIGKISWLSNLNRKSLWDKLEIELKKEKGLGWTTNDLKDLRIWDKRGKLTTRNE